MINPGITLFRLILIASLAMRAVTPVGFMPNAIETGSPFTFCPGDAFSKQLLTVLSQGHHAHHHSESHKVFENQCDFAVLSFSADLESSAAATFPVLPQTEAVGANTPPLRSTRSWLLPPLRAPPTSIT